MRRPALVAAAVAIVAAAPVPPAELAPAAASTDAPGPARDAPAARLPGFAATLADLPTPDGANAWPAIPYADAWAAIARSTAINRQSARWDYARGLIASGRGAEAVGVLDVMVQDDPDLALVAVYQMARGAALTLADRPEDAAHALGASDLAANPEACAWRVLAFVGAGLAKEALAQVDCALPAINSRPAAARASFIVAAARAAIDTNRAPLALQWLKGVPDRDSGANLYRGKAFLALGEEQAARLRLARAEQSGTPEIGVDARLSAIEAAVAHGKMPPADAMAKLDQIRFAWRGGDIEARALRLTAQLAVQAHDLRRALSAGATLVRYFPSTEQDGTLLASLRDQLSAALAPGSGMPIEQAAGLYWDFRDLAPAGADGDLLVNRLADGLQAAGLYARASELLGYQLDQRAEDVAKGPLSVRVASLNILSGRPDLALRAIRRTNGPTYPQDMLWDRARVEAAALHLLGKTAEAMAVLQDVPDARQIGAELLWQKRDWQGLLVAEEPLLPKPGRLSDVDQAVVLRHAIALAMLNREDALAGLRARYAASFQGLPTASSFDVLTRAAGAIDPAQVSRAMSTLPTASPAGKIADLLEAGAPPPPKTS